MVNRNHSDVFFMGRLSEYINGTRRGVRPTYLNSTPRSSGGNSFGVTVQAEMDQRSFEEVSEALARLFITHPETKREMKKMLQQEAKKVRNRISKDVKNNIEDDPRKAYTAVKRSLYKQILGFNVSILNPKRVTRMNLYRKPRKLDENPRQRGGNRRTRSDRTKQLDAYFGSARAFVLRFYNSGTTARITRFGNRGSMPSRRVFETSASFQMQGATDEISKMIEGIMKEEFNNV